MRHRKRRTTLRAVAKPSLVLGAILVMASPVLACPMCKDSTVNTAAKNVVADNNNLSFNKSIYVMLGGLVGVLGFTGRVMYRAAKSSR